VALRTRRTRVPRAPRSTRYALHGTSYAGRDLNLIVNAIAGIVTAIGEGYMRRATLYARKAPRHLYEGE